MWANTPGLRPRGLQMDQSTPVRAGHVEEVLKKNEFRRVLVSEKPSGWATLTTQLEPTKNLYPFVLLYGLQLRLNHLLLGSLWNLKPIKVPLETFQEVSSHLWFQIYHTGRPKPASNLRTWLFITTHWPYGCHSLCFLSFARGGAKEASPLKGEMQIRDFDL